MKTQTEKMSEVVLIIIYNHQYNKNIEILEQIYKDRFSNIYHLIPFYTGDKKNVIPVYECSYHFQGYVSQGFKSYFKDEYKHYFFVADDLILNPVINENNYTQHLKLNANTSFLPEIISLHQRKDFWSHIIGAFRWNINFPGVEAKNQLPDYDTALQMFAKFGIEIKWSIVSIIIFLAWMTLEKKLGFHSYKIKWQPLFNLLYIFPTFILYFLALREKKNKFYNGNINWKQGLISAIVISFIIVIFSPITQFITFSFKTSIGEKFFLM